MKKIVKAAAIAATLVLTTSTYAQNAPRRDGSKAECRTECCAEKQECRKHKPTAEERAEAVTKRMTEALSLSERQAESVYALTLQKLSDEQAVRERYREGLEKILNADQQAELKKRMEERRNRRDSHHGAHRK